MERGEMHWRDGWTFGRLLGGDVRIRHNGEQMALIPANEWVSIIAHLGEGGDYYVAKDLHMKTAATAGV